ncbi:MAG: mRNA surveillance protein pelota [Nanoarchaeota archaeon]
MKLIHSDMKKGEVKVLAQNADDLWYLNAIIEPNDIVNGRTFRKIKIGSAEERAKEAVKRAVFLGIRVEKVEFGRSSNILRVSGVINAAPEDIPLGEHHTFNVEDNTTITITKGKWLKYQLDKIKEACSETKSSILICVHDREEVYFALLKKYGYEVIAHLQGDVKKKREESGKKENFYGKIINSLKEYEERYKIERIIVASPSFWKEDLMKEVDDENLRKKILLATCSSATKNGIEEVIKRPEVKEALKLERAAKEMNKVEELFVEVSKNNLAAYGIMEVQKASDMRAIKDLLVTDSFIQKQRDENKYTIVENIMKTTENSKGDIIIVSSEHDGGNKLDGLGGIGAILRFKLSY